MLSWVFRSKSLLSTARPARYPGLSGQRAYCLPLDRYATLGLQSKSLLSTAKPPRYPGLSGPKAYCLPLEQHAILGFPVQDSTVYQLDQHTTLGLPVQEPTVYLSTNRLPWVFRSKSLPSTARSAHYPGLSGPIAY
ncbi:hypothetical protein ElyMa_001682100 [Elysia marginata]|uniref:Uncharacterized protein n=1 Tax=Elysia marginata TaxID=1093978 RepID=A0AAV4JU17_9GAST|nr:hypothetical protein ElyMa_001682100 [Elysia marginata]